MSLVECQNYGKENNIPWIVSGTWDPNADDGQPAPDHCYIRDSDKPAKGMFFNYRTTPQTATERRNKVCSCNGKDVLPYLNSVKSEYLQKYNEKITHSCLSIYFRQFLDSTRPLD